MNVTAASGSSRHNVLLLLVLGAAVVLLSLRLGREFRAAETPVNPDAGNPSFPVTGEGWLNKESLPDGRPPEFKGKVTVVVAFAHWCVYCGPEAEHVATLKDQYGDKVQFVGMTGEGQSTLRQTRGFLEKHHVTWPIAYGAEKSLEDWKVEFLPSAWIVGRDGKIAWSHQSNVPIEKALEAALEGKVLGVPQTTEKSG